MLTENKDLLLFKNNTGVNSAYETNIDGVFKAYSAAPNQNFCLKESKRKAVAHSELKDKTPEEPEELDLNRYLIGNNQGSTFIVRVSGDSMKGAGIEHGDLLIVDRALQPQSGQIVIALLNDNMLVKRFFLAGEKKFLLPENPIYHAIEITDSMEFMIWGVVKHLIHTFVQE